MELFFRKYFWTANLVFLSLASLLAARTVNTFIASRIEPVPDVEAMAPSHTDKGPARPPGAPSVGVESVAALFGVILPAPPTEKPDDKPKYDPNAPPVRSSLRISLVGTMVASQSAYSMATIRDDQAQESGVYMEGDDILGAKVLTIERLKVTLMNEGRKEFIAIGDATPPPPTVASIAQPSTSGDAPEAGDANIQKIDDDHFSLGRDEVEKQLSNMSVLATQARIVPSFKDGVANGFKLFSIQPGSIYSKLGIQNGDVIKRINGYEINSPDKALEVYSRLKESSRIEFDIERRGQDSKKVVNIQN